MITTTNEPTPVYQAANGTKFTVLFRGENSSLIRYASGVEESLANSYIDKKCTKVSPPEGVSMGGSSLYYTNSSQNSSIKFTPKVGQGAEEDVYLYTVNDNGRYWAGMAISIKALRYIVEELEKRLQDNEPPLL